MQHVDFTKNLFIYTSATGNKGAITCQECLDLIEEFNNGVQQLEDHMEEIADA